MVVGIADANPIYALLPTIPLVASIVVLIAWSLATAGGRRVPMFTTPGACADCGFCGEGLESERCPECASHLPAGGRHMTALLAVHAATGPSVCVVCGLRAESGGRCPGCGSSHRRAVQ